LDGGEKPKKPNIGKGGVPPVKKPTRGIKQTETEASHLERPNVDEKGKKARGRFLKHGVRPQLDVLAMKGETMFNGRRLVLDREKVRFGVNSLLQNPMRDPLGGNGKLRGEGQERGGGGTSRRKDISGEKAWWVGRIWWLGSPPGKRGKVN